MMVEERISEAPYIENRTQDVSSSSIRDSDNEDECQSEGQQIVAPDECGSSFGNIVVKNSSDVHFGNKTHYAYEGPVTIKQFVHTDEGDDRKSPIENSERNHFGSQPEIVIQTDEESGECTTTRIDNHDGQSVNEDKEIKTEIRKGTNWKTYGYKERKRLTICLTIIVFTILFILLIVFFVNSDNSNTDPSWQEESNLSGKLKIILRNEWLSESPKEKLNSLSTPVPNVIIAHTVTENCENRGECTRIIRFIQQYHMKNLRFSDIGYNFVIGGDGYVYEGRGWKNAGAHTKNWNSQSIGIGFIGTFIDILPPKHQISAAYLLIEHGVKDNYLAQDYKLYAQLQVRETQSPGEVFYENIKTWPHWTNTSYVKKHKLNK